MANLPPNTIKDEPYTFEVGLFW